MKQLTLNLKTENNLGKVRKEALISEILNEQELDIFKTLQPFSSRDEMRPALCSIFFDKPGGHVVTSDGHKLISIKYKSEHYGVFRKYNNEIVKIQEPFPDYKRVIRDDKSSFIIKKLEVQPLIDFVKQVLPLTIKKEPAAYFHAFGENGVGLDCKILLPLLELQKKWKNKTVDISFSLTNPNSRSVQMYSESPFGKTTMLIMPRLFFESYPGSQKNDLLENNVVLPNSIVDKPITGMYSFEQKGLYEPPDDGQAQAQRIRILKLKYQFKSI